MRGRSGTAGVGAMMGWGRRRMGSSSLGLLVLKDGSDLAACFDNIEFVKVVVAEFVSLL